MTTRTTAPSVAFVRGVQRQLLQATVVVLLLLCLFRCDTSSILVAAKTQEVECQADGTCAPTNDAATASKTTTTERATKQTTGSSSSSFPKCGLYMAPSAITGSGWGLYTGVELQKNTTLSIKDVVIQYIDAKRHFFNQKLMHKNDSSKILRNDPLLANYITSALNSSALYDALDVTSVSPGIPALMNYHLGMYNVGPTQCLVRTAGERTSPTAGASSAYQKCQVSTTRHVPRGHELLAEISDDWFLDRTDQFGYNVPTKQDYMGLYNVILLWRQSLENFDGDGDKMHELWDAKYEETKTLMSKGQHRLWPKSAMDAFKVELYGERNGVGYLEYPDVIRSMDWLEQNGICLDQVGSKPLSARPTERTATARRDFAAGTVVTTTPLIHLSRQQLEMIHIDAKSQPTTTMWQGHQLLLNYCYGHSSSSVLLFPYGPSVNLINHPQPHQEANVAVRWSSTSQMAHPEWLELNSSSLLTLHQNTTGLVMEYYALTEIAKGDELLLDYGPTWQAAWDRHVDEWNRRQEQDRSAKLPADSLSLTHEYVSAFNHSKQCDKIIKKTGKYECIFYPPRWIETRCWIHPRRTKIPEFDNSTIAAWSAPKNDQDVQISLDPSYACQVLAVLEDDTYRVRIQWHKKKKPKEITVFSLDGVPRAAIFMVDQRYTNHQMLRAGFRHEIQLPDAMVPAAWKDLEPEPHSKCGLYMAESAIPHSGLGMYTAQPIAKGDRIFFGDVVVQVEDMDLNTKLRHWSNKNFDYEENDWLFNNYYWNPRNSMGNYDATSVQSIIPGLGMLANSHTGLVNADIKAPRRFSGLHRGKDPGTGASTTYHDVHFDATVDIEGGSEIFVEYGDSWFEDRENVMGLIPLSDDFENADASLKKFVKVVDKTNKKRNAEMVLDALRLLGNVTSIRPRLANAIPKDIKGLEQAVEKGTASLTVPNRVRSIEWLEKNGRCLDNIRPDISTVRQAGRGAFATRTVRKGDVIAPMPLVHVRRRHMAVYGGDDYDDKDTSVWLDGIQLLMNYCYSHPESSILLFPYSPVVNYVNHQSESSGKVNAELRWSSLPNHRTDWLKRTPNDLDSEDHAGLIMELVATREIKAGEEIFVNYGSHWDTAWNKHVEKWNPTEADKHFVSTAELNERVEWLKTVEELKTDPYPFSNNEDIFTMCFVESLQGSVVDGKSVTIPWTGSDELFDTTNEAYPCHILKRSFDTSRLSLEQVQDRSASVGPMDVKYTVRLQLKQNKVATVEGVPRKAIQFFDAKYMSDNFLRSAFRHEMHLPDAMVPAAWRDLKRE